MFYRHIKLMKWSSSQVFNPEGVFQQSIFITIRHVLKALKRNVWSIFE